jgi:hypothetical protein
MVYYPSPLAGDVRMIKTCVAEIAGCLLNKHSKRKVQKIQLSKNTAHRRIEDV